jgi:hypothetical protein
MSVLRGSMAAANGLVRMAGHRCNVIPGRAEGANPESRHTDFLSFWIPGSPLRGAPE